MASKQMYWDLKITQKSDWYMPEQDLLYDGRLYERCFVRQWNICSTANPICTMKALAELEKKLTGKDEVMKAEKKVEKRRFCIPQQGECLARAKISVRSARLRS